MNYELRMTNDERMRGSKRASRFKVSDFIRHCILLALLFLSYSAHACSVCFGGTDSQLSRGMLAGVLVLLLVVLSVLGGFVALFVYLARRAAATGALENPATVSKA